MTSFTTWRDDQSQVSGTSQYIGPQPLIRNDMDAARMMWRREPSAHYPDGYIDSAITGRRGERVGEAVWRQQSRPYMRGVHKGERIDMSDYLWPKEFHLYSALEQEAMGLRFVSPSLQQEPIVLHNDGKPSPRDPSLGRVGTPVQLDMDRASALRRLAPPWR